MLADPAAVASALDPIRSRILAVLAEPHSAASIATQVNLTRQKVNYHLKALEGHGLIEPVETRAWGGITERVMQAVAARLVISPGALQPSSVQPDNVTDRLSAAYLIAVAGRTVCEVGDIVRHATNADQRLPTLTVDTVVGFASAADRTAFADELQAAVIALVARYHHDDGRPYRLVTQSYPRPTETSTP